MPHVFVIDVPAAAELGRDELPEELAGLLVEAAAGCRSRPRSSGRAGARCWCRRTRARRRRWGCRRSGCPASRPTSRSRSWRGRSPRSSPCTPRPWRQSAAPSPPEPPCSGCRPRPRWASPRRRRVQKPEAEAEARRKDKDAEDGRDSFLLLASGFWLPASALRLCSCTPSRHPYCMIRRGDKIRPCSGAS